MDDVLKRVIKKIKPSKIEYTKFMTFSEDIISKISNKLTKINAKAILGGSSAKNTWLSDNKDIDIFIQFNYNDYNNKNDQLSDILEKIIKDTFPNEEVKRLHGSRDYFQIEINNIVLEFIPILEINDSKESLNITDISPLHSKWVNKKRQELKGIEDQIRLSKQFCKGQKLYGAESYLGGFSGYILEIMTIYYGSFEKLLRKSINWKSPVIIDPEKYYKKNMVMFEIDKSKLNSPIIIVDPVDNKRNAAAALTNEKFKSFKNSAKEFLRHKDEKIFTKKEIKLKDLQTICKKDKLNLIYLEIEPLAGKKDVIGAKILKVFKNLNRNLKKFNIKKADWEWDQNSNAKMYFLFKKNKLPKSEIKIGPPIKIKDHAKIFKETYPNHFIKDNQLFSKVLIKQRGLMENLNKRLQHKYITEKVKSIKIISETSKL